MALQDNKFLDDILPALKSGVSRPSEDDISVSIHPRNKLRGVLESCYKSEIASVIYHDIFDYPLNTKEIIKWSVGKKGCSLFKNTKEILNKDGRYFLLGREKLLYKKTLRERSSGRKVEIAKKSASILSWFPNIKGVFVTGSLAMNNAKEEGDIDLMIITKENCLWITRLFVYFVLKIINFAVRKPNDTNQKDKLCLNIWLDESALSWSKNDRNIYSAHEIAQIVPIVDKNNIYQSFLQKNVWILDYWPNAVHIERIVNKQSLQTPPKFIENLAFKIQHLYMKSKITSEKVTMHKAIFHPRDWGKEINELLSA